MLDKKYIDDNLIKCLSDLMNNRRRVFIVQILSINVMKMLPKLFKSFFSLTKVEYLISLMKFYENNSVENMAAAIISLNIISYNICGDIFNFEYFNKNSNIKKIFMNQNLSEILLDIKKGLIQKI